MRFRYALGFWIGAWAGALLAALILLTIDSSYDAQTLAGGYRLREGAILALIAGGAFVGGLLGVILSQRRP